MPRRRRKRFKNKATVTADSFFFRFLPYGHACAESQSVHDIYNRISYTRTRAERRAAKENACACVHIRKRTYDTVTRRRGFCAQPPGREKSVRLMKGIGAPPDSVSPHARKGAGLAQGAARATQGAARAIYFNSFMIGFALPVTYRLFSSPVIFICRPQRFCRKKKAERKLCFRSRSFIAEALSRFRRLYQI